MKQLGVGHAKAVVAKSTQTHGAKVFVTNRNRLGRAPLLVGLLAGAEKVDIAFKRRLKQLVPVFEVRQHRNGLCGQLVHTGAKHVGYLAFIDKHRHLRLPHRQGRAVLNLQVGDRKAPGQRAVVIFSPLNDVDELFLDEVHKSHGALPFGFVVVAKVPIVPLTGWPSTVNALRETRFLLTTACSLRAAVRQTLAMQLPSQIIKMGSTALVLCGLVVSTRPFQPIIAVVSAYLDTDNHHERSLPGPFQPVG